MIHERHPTCPRPKSADGRERPFLLAYVISAMPLTRARRRSQSARSAFEHLLHPTRHPLDVERRAAVDLDMCSPRDLDHKYIPRVRDSDGRETAATAGSGKSSCSRMPTRRTMARAVAIVMGSGTA